MDRTRLIEELSSIQIVRREVTERNTLYAMDEKVAMLMKATDIPSGPAKIQKVTSLLRGHKEFEEYFEPIMASLGPIHHGNPKYGLGEKYKLRLAHEYVKHCDKDGVISHQQINKLYQKIMENIRELRERFQEGVTEKYNDDDLAWMLLVDGCAILEYMLSTAKDMSSEVNIKKDRVTFARQDLFLLENQVPYLLLKLLMSLSEKKYELELSMGFLILRETMAQMGGPQLVRLVPCSWPPEPSEPAEPSEPEGPTHLLDLLRTRLLGDKKAHPFSRKNSEKKQEYPYWQPFRNVQQLKAAGIHVRHGPSSILRDISFVERRRCFLSGDLWLPQIKVDDSTGHIFMNLIAYEMCSDFNNDFGINSYMFFLRSLISEANDAKQLREEGVLLNFLGSDEEVANLFNEIGTLLAPNLEAYKEVRCQIQDYYDKNWLFHIAKWITQLRQDYFSNPWSAIALLVASSLLFLTATQTWFAVWPRK